MGNALGSGGASSARTALRAKSTDTEGHEVGSSNVYSDENHEAETESFQKHQSRAERLPFAVEAKTLVDLGRYGVISTLGARGAGKGFPNGSVVGYAAIEGTGLPVFVFSTLSSHTGDVDADGRFSLTVTATGFRGASDARVTITGRAEKVEDAAAKEALKKAYKSKHPDAFWIDFGDFSLYQCTELVQVRLVGGFARAGSISPGDYAEAKVDDIVQFSAPICGHMNDDHSEQVPLVSWFVLCCCCWCLELTDLF